VADEDGRGGGVLLADAFVVAFVAVAAGLDFSVRVAAGVAFADAPEWAAPELEVPVVAPAIVVRDGLVVVDVGVCVADDVVGVAVGVLVAVGVVGGVAGGVGVCEVGVGEGDWLGGAGSCSGSHD
jgi:hypothetical protein